MRVTMTFDAMHPAQASEILGELRSMLMHEYNPFEWKGHYTHTSTLMHAYNPFEWKGHCTHTFWVASEYSDKAVEVKVSVEKAEQWAL